MISELQQQVLELKSMMSALIEKQSLNTQDENNKKYNAESVVKVGFFN